MNQLARFVVTEIPYLTYPHRSLDGIYNITSGLNRASGKLNGAPDDKNPPPSPFRNSPVSQIFVTVLGLPSGFPPIRYFDRILTLKTLLSEDTNEMKPK
jgi:hypothetical protein